MPERGDIVISRDAMGRTVFYDQYGNLLATEMPSGYQQRQQQVRQRDTTYYPPAPGGQYREPQRDYGYQDNGSVRDYREYRGDGSDDNFYTGSVPAPGAVESGPLGQPMPGESTTAAVPQPEHLIERHTLLPRRSTVPVRKSSRFRPSSTAKASRRA